MTQHAELIRRLETNAALMPSDAAVALAYKAAAEALKEQAVEIERLRKDAERYAWLRHGDNDEKVLCNGPVAKDYWYLPRNERLDAAIDAAMTKGSV